MKASFLGAVIHFALRPVFVFTDALSLIASVLLPALATVLGWSSSEFAARLSSFAIVVAVGGVVVLRLLTAPYFIWRQQNERIEELENQLAAPEQVERRRIAEHLGDVRSRLATELAQIGAEANRYERTGNRRGGLPVNEAQELINQLSYDEPLRTLCLDYLQCALTLIDKKDNHEDDREERTELHRLGKTVFKSLHRA